MAQTPVLELDTGVFERFQLFQGMVPAGFFTDCLGTMTRQSFRAFAPDVQARLGCSRHERHGVPNDEQILDMLYLLKAVDQARGQFTMAELGAGWGRWLVCAAAAAHQRDLRFHLIGVEAEPTHFSWISTHFRDNGIDAGEHILIEAAAVAKPGEVWFCVGDAADWYGQAAVAEDRVEEKNGRMEYCGREVRKVTAIDLATLLDRSGPLDYLHMDVQGAELEFLASRPDLLDRHVRRVFIGTHSPEIEAGLRKLFTALGWICEFDFPLGTKLAVGGSEIEMGDGAQAWVRPHDQARAS